MAAVELKDLLKIKKTVTFTGVTPGLFKILTGREMDPVEQVLSLVAAAAPLPHTLGGPATIEHNIRAAIYQDDDAHENCSLTACLDPLHPGPCKGWKHSLFSTAPQAWHALEAARVEKANKKRLAKIEDLKSKGLPVPHKLTIEITPKSQPHVGKTANKASGDAHKAGLDVSANAGIHVSEPGKVTLGQAAKKLELGPKGKKPTVASKGIAHVIAQEKVTPQYKLDKAAAITPAQWDGLSDDDKSVVRGELAKIKKDGFGPQQKKADELLAKLPAGVQPTAPQTVTTPSVSEVAPHHVPKNPGEPLSAKNYTPTMSDATKMAQSFVDPPKIHSLQTSFSERFKTYQKLNAEEWKALPEGTKTAIVHDVVGVAAADKQLHQGFIAEDGKAYTPASAWLKRRNIELPPLEQGKIDKWVSQFAKDKPVKPTPVTHIPEKTSVKGHNVFGEYTKIDKVEHPKYEAAPPKAPETVTTPLGKTYQKIEVKPASEPGKPKELTPEEKAGVEAKAAANQAKAKIEDDIVAKHKASPPAVKTHAEYLKDVESKSSGKNQWNAKSALHGGHVETSVKGLPKGYMITKDSMGLTLKHKGKIIRTSSDKASLELYAHKHDAAVKEIQAAHAGDTPTTNFKISKLTPEKVDATKLPADEPKTPEPGKFDHLATVKKTGQPATVSLTPTNVVKEINKNGSAHLLVKGKPVEVGFEGSGKEAKLTMASGGGYTVTMPDGEKVQFGKGEHMQHIPNPAAKAAETPEAPKGNALKDAIAKNAARASEDFEKATNRPSGLSQPLAKPKALPKHVTEAIDMAHGKALGASWSKNHLAAYQKLTPEEFKALDPDTKSKIVAELKKGETKFLDPKKVQATKDLLAKFQGDTSVPKEPVKEADFFKDMNNHAITEAQAKKAVEAVLPQQHANVAKTVAGLSADEMPDTIVHKHTAIGKANDLSDLASSGKDAKILKDPQVVAADNELHSAAFKQYHAEAVLSAKAKAFNKVTKKLTDDEHATTKLSPMQKASLAAYQKHLLDHPVKTDSAEMDKLKNDTAAAYSKLSDAHAAALKKLNAPSVENMSNAQVTDRAVELLGPLAKADNLSASTSDMQYAEKMAKAAVESESSKYPAAVLSDPAVAAASVKMEAAVKSQNVLLVVQHHVNDILKTLHQDALNTGTDIHGDKLSADDKKVIEKHAALIADKYAHFKVEHDAQVKKVAEAKAEFNKAAEKAHTPPEPVGLSDYDKTTIESSYANAWAKHANSAINHGVKTFNQVNAMKAHPEYAGLQQDSKDLKVLAGRLAVAHALEHTAKENVPTDPDTGSLQIMSPEGKEWTKAELYREQLEKDFNALHKQAQAKLDKIRTDNGLKKRTLPKLDANAVKATAAESGYMKTGGYSGPNFGKSAAAKNYMLAKAGPKIAVGHKTQIDKQQEKLSGVTPGPAASTGKIKNAGEPVTISGGDIAHLPATLKSTITQDFKSMPSGKYLADPTEDIFANLVNLAAAHGKGVDGGLSVDQVLKTIDETHSKNLGVANSGMLHKKITDWLGTSTGKEWAEAHSQPDTKVVKKLNGEIDLPAGVTLAPGEHVQKLSWPGAHDESIPASAFKALTAKEAQAAQDKFLEDNGIKFTAAQKKDIKAYTGNGHGSYSTFNNCLRGKGPCSTATKQSVVNIQSAMQPLPQHTLLKRGTGWPDEIASFASHPHDLLGKTFEDKAFTSSTVAGSSGHFSGKPLQLTIEAPKGTPAAFINSISHYEGQENEMLLAAGAKFKVLSVEVKNGHTHMRVRVVGDK